MMSWSPCFWVQTDVLHESFRSLSFILIFHHLWVYLSSCVADVEGGGLLRPFSGTDINI